IAELARLGLRPEDVDLVVNSHLHPDHCGCNAYFARASVVVHARELAAARATDSAKVGYLACEWDHPLPMRVIEAEYDLFGDGRIVLTPLPGHPPGTIGALAGLERSGTFLLASDAVTLRASLDRDIVPRNTWHAESFLATLAEIRRIERAGATILCG